MAQEAVRRDELADHLTTFKSVASTALTGSIGASWVVPVPFASRPIERIQCSLYVDIYELEDAIASTQYDGPVTTALYCQEVGETVGMASTGISSSVFVAPATWSRITEVPCVRELTTTWLRQPTVLRQLTLTLLDSTGAPFGLLEPSIGGTMNMQIVARFTFFGPRDTRLF